MDQCNECGFTYDLGGATEAGPSIRAGAEEYATLLRRTDPAVTTRPAPTVWSPLEYGCHLRDVLLVQRERVLHARRTQQPAPEPMGRDERVEHDGYADQDPADVARQLTDAAQLFAHVLSRLGRGDWERTLVYNYPEPTVRSLRWVGVHTLHEVRHHLLDANRHLSSNLP
ncbi:DinB family protein [Actinopolymorpha sp. B17G11]|uniref:DinB family protein n=1 Tax=unclassified Actinopolymorpha TaxID=2627063 RepID=UPI0032D8F1B5